jgi:hypothetical protein
LICRIVGNFPVPGPQYFTRQAATLLRWAKSIKDPEAAAALVGKAAELTAQAGQASKDISPKAPDVQPEDSTPP